MKYEEYYIEEVVSKNDILCFHILEKNSSNEDYDKYVANINIEDVINMKLNDFTMDYLFENGDYTFNQESVSLEDIDKSNSKNELIEANLFLNNLHHLITHNLDEELMHE